MISGIAAPVALSTSASNATPSAPEAQLVVNGSFESGTAGWATARNRQVLSATRPAVSGAASARLTVTAGSRVALRTTMPSVNVADPASTYTVTAFVRSTGISFPGRLRVREYVGGRWVDQHGVDFTASGSWKKVTLVFKPTTTGSLYVAVVADSLPRRTALLVDDVTMTSVKPPKPTPTPTPTPTPAHPDAHPDAHPHSDTHPHSDPDAYPVTVGLCE